MKERWLPLWLLAGVSLACASTPASTPELEPVATGEVEVTVTGFENDTGQALMSLYVGEAGWPDDADAAHEAVALPIRDRTVVFTFTDVPAGSFAVAVFHDEDLDEDLDQNFFGMPTEDYGFSQDARGRFGPPSFEDARLTIEAADSLRIAIEIR